MKAKFQMRDMEYEVVLEKRERAEGDKFNPHQATVSGQPGGSVQGTCQITDDALKLAEDKAAEDARSRGELLAEACGRALASELVIRPLKPGFSFVVDHRWLD